MDLLRGGDDDSLPILFVTPHKPVTFMPSTREAHMNISLAPAKFFLYLSC